jgi:hypothetical protein
MNNFLAIVFGEISRNLVLRLSEISIVATKKQEGKPLMNIIRFKWMSKRRHTIKNNEKRRGEKRYREK